jgi:hypothetical protein
MRKTLKKLRLNTETILQLSHESMTTVAGAYPPSAPRTCRCVDSEVSQCVCSLDVSVCW